MEIMANPRRNCGIGRCAFGVDIRNTYPIAPRTSEAWARFRSDIVRAANETNMKASKAHIPAKVNKLFAVNTDQL